MESKIQYSLATAYTEPNHTSAIATQFFFEEPGKAINQKGVWIHFESALDGYSGWVLSACVSSVSAKEFNALCKRKKIKTKQDYIVPIGSLVEGEAQPLGKNRLQNVALGFLGVPYMWGGKSVFGVDCSGLTQIIMRCLQVYLPRDAKDQAQHGEPILWQHRDTLDLVFFGEEHINHVGILWDKDLLLHASEHNGAVCLQAIDENGLEHNGKIQKTKSVRRFPIALASPEQKTPSEKKKK